MSDEKVWRTRMLKAYGKWQRGDGSWRDLTFEKILDAQEEIIILTAADYDALQARVARIATLESQLAAKTAECEHSSRQFDEMKELCNTSTSLLTQTLDQRDAVKRRSCGCVVCVCEDDVQCQGCGAKDCDYHAAMRTERDTALAELATAREECERLRGEQLRSHEWDDGSLSIALTAMHGGPRSGYIPELLNMNVKRMADEINTLRAHAARGKE